jgi:hypothetical protein
MSLAWQGGGLTASEADELRRERKALLDERAALQRELERCAHIHTRAASTWVGLEKIASHRMGPGVTFLETPRC